MAILSRDEYFTRLNERLGEDSSDESISFLEDMTDTYNDLANKAAGDGVDWEQKYKDLDETWKKRYRNRFFSGTGGDYIPADGKDEETYNADEVKVEDLFEERKD